MIIFKVFVSLGVFMPLKRIQMFAQNQMSDVFLRHNWKLQ